MSVQEEIRDLLKTMEQGCTRQQFDTLEQRLEILLHQEGLAFQDVGISEQRLDEMRRGACKHTALYWLRRLRAGVTHQYANFITYVRQELTEGALSLTEVGTSDMELEELRILGCKTTSLWYLERMRLALATDGLVSPSDLESFKEELAEGHMHIMDVELTRAELSKLERSARRVRNMIIPRQVA